MKIMQSSACNTQIPPHLDAKAGLALLTPLPVTEIAACKTCRLPTAIAECVAVLRIAQRTLLVAYAETFVAHLIPDNL